jgi:hypothetical protein
LAVTYLPGAVRVTVARPGDVNLDQSITALGDFSPALGNLGDTTVQTWADGDVTGDGAVTALGG